MGAGDGVGAGDPEPSVIAEAGAGAPNLEVSRDRSDLLVALAVILLLFGVTGYVNAMPLGAAEDDLDELLAEVWDRRDDAALAAANGGAGPDAMLDLANAAVDDARRATAPPDAGAGSEPAGPQDPSPLVDASQLAPPATAETEPSPGSPTPSAGGTPSTVVNPEPRLPDSDPPAGPLQSPARSSPSGSVDPAPAVPADATPVRDTRTETTVIPEDGPTPQPIATLEPGDLPTPAVEPTPPLLQPTPTPDVYPTVSPPTATPAVAETATPDPTSTPNPTRTPRPTATEEPTVEPTATTTPQPSLTPTATSTSVPTAGPTVVPTTVPTLGPTATPLPSGLSCGTPGGVCVSGGVRGVRVLVVDLQGNILQIWSNSDAPLEVVVRIGTVSGVPGTLSPALEASYAQIAATIPPGARGLVYVRPTP